MIGAIYRIYKNFPVSSLMLAGGLSGLGYAPISLNFLTVAGFALFYNLLISAPTLRRKLTLTFLFHFTYYTVSTFWIYYSFEIYIDEFWWAVPFAILGIPAIMATIQLPGALAAHISKSQGYSRVFFVASIFLLMEYLRSHHLTMFPFAQVGQVWASNLYALQITSSIGLYGLSFLTLFFSFALGTSKNLYDGIKLFLIPVCVLGFGAYRVHTTKLESTSHSFRVINTNIPQRDKWKSLKQRVENLQKNVEYSSDTKAIRPSIVVWPETAVEFPIITKDRKYVFSPPEVSLFLKKTLFTNELLLLGTVLHEDNKTYSVMALVDHMGNIHTLYKKYMLVPFGEYIPSFLRSLPLISNSVETRNDFIAGPGAEILQISNLKISPLICYEASFSGHIRPKGTNVDVLVSINNEGWFGHWGDKAHFAIHRIRCAEEGFPMVRSANEGISGYTDPIGRISITHPEDKFLDISIHQPLKTTLYRKIVDLPFGPFCIHLTLLFVGLLLEIFAILKRRKHTKR